MSMRKNYTLIGLQEKIREEKNPEKRRQLKLLLEEMAEIYPDVEEIPKDPLDLFMSPKQWKNLKHSRKLIMSIRGESFTGKSYNALTASHVTPKWIDYDFRNITEKNRLGFKKYIGEYIPFTPLWVIGTEESTLECLRTMDNEDYFSKANINFIECLQKGETGMSLVDHLKTYKRFLTALYTIRNQERGTLIIDPISPILNAQHEIIRRIVRKVPKLKSEQGIPTRYWFWRNAEQEGIWFFLRMLKMNVICTVKVIIQSTESQKEIEKTRWHEETNKHLSSVILKSTRNANNDFISYVEKCRPAKDLTNKMMKNLTIPDFMYNLYLNKVRLDNLRKKRLQELKKQQKTKK